MKQLKRRLKRWWCRQFHHKITHPTRGKYECLTCFEIFTCDIEVPNATNWRPTRVPAQNFVEAPDA